MSTVSTLFQRLFLFVLLSASAIAVRAGTIEQSWEFEDRATNFQQTFVVEQFNPALGRLTSVEIDFSDEFDNSGTFTNTGNGTGLFSATFSDQIRLYDWNGDLLVSSSGGATTGNVKLKKSNGTYSYELHSFSTSGEMEFSDDLDVFIGSDTLSMMLAANATVTLRGSGNSRMTARTTVSGDFEVIYHYQPALFADTTSVPEPPAAALLLLGVGLLGLTRRR